MHAGFSIESSVLGMTPMHDEENNCDDTGRSTHRSKTGFRRFQPKIQEVIHLREATSYQ